MRFDIKFALLFPRVEILIRDSITALNKVDHCDKTGLPGYLLGFAGHAPACVENKLMWKTVFRLKIAISGFLRIE